MTTDPSGGSRPRAPAPEVLLADLESSLPSPVRIAQLRQDVVAIHDHPLAVGVEPLTGVRFEDEGPRPVDP